jgi:hypothetical protein
MTTSDRDYDPTCRKHEGDPAWQLHPADCDEADRFGVPHDHDVPYWTRVEREDAR